MDTFNGLPLLKISLDGDEHGVDKISLVDEPAIGENWLHFRKVNEEELEQMFEKIISEQKLAGALLIPNKPILRQHPVTKEKFYVTFPKEVVREIASRFNKNLFGGNWNTQHKDDVKDVYVSENWIIEDSESDKSNNFGHKLPEGTWYGIIKVDNDSVWTNDIESGNLRGFSIELVSGLKLEAVEKSIQDFHFESHVKGILESKSVGEEIDEKWIEISDYDLSDEEETLDNDSILNLSIVADGNEDSFLDKTIKDLGRYKVRYRYMGVRDNKNRDFCASILDYQSENTVFRKEDINMMSFTTTNPQFGTYSIFRYKGSYGCRHYWKRVIFFDDFEDKVTRKVGNVPIVTRGINKRADKDAKTINAYLHRLELAGFKPNQKRGNDGRWGSVNCLEEPIQNPKLLTPEESENIIKQFTHYKSGDNFYPTTTWANWFLGEDLDSKNKIAYVISTNENLQDALKSSLYHFTKDINNYKKTFSEFLKDKITVYRGISKGNAANDGKYDSNGFTSWALERSLAEYHGDTGQVIEEEMSVSEVWGAVNIVGGEIEVLEPQPYSEDFAQRLFNEEGNALFNSGKYSGKEEEEIIEEAYKIKNKKGINCAFKYLESKNANDTNLELAGFKPNQKRSKGGRWTKNCSFESWFGDSKLVDENGDPKKVYHGSTHEFSEFTKARGNIENDMGVGFYFSSSLTDVETNYDSLQGADLKGRIERLAERLESDLEIDYQSAMEKATSKLAGRNPNIIEAYISMGNPFVIGGENQTFLDYSYTDEGEESGLILDFFENYAMASAGYHDVDPNRVFEGMEFYDGMRAEDLIKSLKANEALAYATDSEGNLASNEIIRNTLELMGFDGVVDRTVSRFKMDGVYPDTEHVIVFEPNQIKRTDNESWCIDTNNINLSELNKNKMGKQKLAGFKPNQKRSEDGTWGSENWHKIKVSTQIKSHKEGGGSTYNTKGESMNGEKGMASVAIFPEKSEEVTGNLTEEILNEFIEKNKDLLSDKDTKNAVGTWLDTNTGITWLDIINVLPLEEAIELGHEHNQIAIWDLENMVEYPIGGTGANLQKQKLNNLKMGKYNFEMLEAIPMEDRKVGASVDNEDGTYKIDGVSYVVLEKKITEVIKEKPNNFNRYRRRNNFAMLEAIPMEDRKVGASVDNEDGTYEIEGISYVVLANVITEVIEENSGEMGGEDVKKFMTEVMSWMAATQSQIEAINLSIAEKTETANDQFKSVNEGVEKISTLLSLLPAKGQENGNIGGASMTSSISMALNKIKEESSKR